MYILCMLVYVLLNIFVLFSYYFNHYTSENMASVGGNLKCNFHKNKLWWTKKMVWKLLRYFVLFKSIHDEKKNIYANRLNFTIISKSFENIHTLSKKNLLFLAFSMISLKSHASEQNKFDFFSGVERWFQKR